MSIFKIDIFIFKKYYFYIFCKQSDNNPNHFFFGQSFDTILQNRNSTGSIVPTIFTVLIVIYSYEYNQTKLFWQFTLLFLFTNTKCIKYKSCSKFCPLSIQKLYKQFDLLCYTISVTVLIVFVLQIRFKINIFELYNFIQSNFVIKAIQFMLNLYIFDQY